MDYNIGFPAGLPPSCCAIGGLRKLAFFAPNGQKYTFKVISFGPINAPSFYTAMMKEMKDKWNILFSIAVLDLKTFH